MFRESYVNIEYFRLGSGYSVLWILLSTGHNTIPFLDKFALSKYLILPNPAKLTINSFVRNL